MGNVLLAIEKDLMDNIVKVYYGNIAWGGIQEATLLDISSNKIELDNIRVSDRNELVHTKGDLRKYTTIVDGKTLKKSYVVLAEAHNPDIIYFVTDGLNNPIWIKREDLKDKILKDKIDLANSKLEFNNDELTLIPTEECFNQVDYTKTQLEYRKYLKSAVNLKR